MALDNLGRDVDGGGTGREFAEALLRRLPNPKPVIVQHTDADRQSFENIKIAVNDLEKVLDNNTDDQLDVLKDILKEIQNQRFGQQSPRSSSSSSSTSTTSTGASRTRTTNVAVIPRVNNRRASTVANAASGAMPTAAAGSKGFIKSLGLANITTLLTSAVFTGLGNGMDLFVKNTGVRFGAMFDGLIKEEFSFSTGMKSIINQTREYGKSIEETQNEYIHFGRVTREIGFERAKLEVTYMKTMQKGLTQQIKGGKLVKQNAKEHRNMLKGALSTAYSIGSEAESTAETFDNWQRSLSLNNTSLYQVGSSLKNISRETGVTGENLMSAAKNSEVLLKTLKVAGNLSASTMASIIKSNALATKYGIEEVNSALDQGLSSFSEAIKMNDKELQAFLMRAVTTYDRVHGLGKTPAMSAWQSGNLLDESNIVMKNKAIIEEMSRSIDQLPISDILMKNLEDMNINVANFGNNFGGKNSDGISTAEAYEKHILPNFDSMLNNLKMEQMRTNDPVLAHRIQELQMILPQMGLEVGNVSAMTKKYLEEMKTPNERIAELEKIVSSSDSTDLAKAAAEKDIKEIKFNRIESALTEYKNVIHGGGTKEMALQNATTRARGSGLLGENESFDASKFESTVSNNINDMIADMEKLGYQNSNAWFSFLGDDDLNDVISEATDGKLGSMQAVQDALMSGDSTSVATAEEALQSINNILRADKQTEQNPVEEIMKSVREINDNLKIYSQAIIGMMGFKELAGIMTSIIGTKFGATVIGGSNIARSYKNWRTGKNGPGGSTPGMSGIGRSPSPSYGPRGNIVLNRNLPRQQRMETINNRRFEQGKTPLNRRGFSSRGGRGKFGRILAGGMDLLALTGAVSSVAGNNTNGGLSDFSNATPVYVVNFHEMGMGMGGGLPNPALYAADAISNISGGGKKGFFGRTFDKTKNLAKSAWDNTGGKAFNFVKGTGVGRKALDLGSSALKGVGSVGAKALDLGGTALKGVGSVGGKALKGAGKLGGKALAKVGGKSLLKKIPGIGLLAGLAFGAQRALAGDWTGAGLELASGAASTIPGLGTAGSVALDAALMAKDAGAFDGGGTPSVVADMGVPAGLEGAGGGGILSGIGSLLSSPFGLAGAAASGIAGAGAGLWNWLSGSTDSSVAELGAFDGNKLVKEGLSTESLVSDAESALINSVSASDPLPVTVINTGAFSDSGESSLNKRMNDLAGSGKDYNQVIETVKEHMTKGAIIGGATKAMYLTEQANDDLDENLANSYSNMYSVNTTQAGASMFTPEDAADYVMQQMAGSTPTSAMSMGSLEYLSKLQEEQNIMTAQMLEELRIFNSRGGVIPGGGSTALNGSVRKDNKSTMLGNYRKEPLRGNFTGIQAIPNNHQDNLDIRPA